MNKQVSAASSPDVMIVLVNWNRYRDTLACLESLVRLDYPRFFVVVCDNGSTDGSIEFFRQWTVKNDVAFRCFTVDELPSQELPNPPNRSLICFSSHSNRGFAGANNLALAYALRLRCIDYVWLLNNDTVVDSAALTALLNVAGTSADIGLCGSSVLCMDRTDTVQCLGGGRYNIWSGWTRHIGAGLEWPTLIRDADLRGQVENQLDYVYGASVLVSRRFLQEVGLMSEDYFLYFEELDWAERARGRYKMSYAPDSVVWHKEGASTISKQKVKSELADYYLIRNRVLYTRRYHPSALLFILAGLIVSMGNRIVRRQTGRIPLLIKAAWDGVRKECN